MTRKPLFASVSGAAILLGAMSLTTGVWAQDGEVSQGPDRITVIGYRAQTEQAVERKRSSELIAEFLLSDDIGQQPDYNIADSFRRVPGVQTIFDEDEGRYVSIRGLNPSYTLGSLDGATLATAERFNRQLNLEAIPSTAVRGLEVIKSRTPDVDGNAIGGTINLVTRSAFDADGLYAVGNFFVGVSDSQGVPGEGFGRDSDDGLNFRIDGTISSVFGRNEQFGVLFTGSYSRKRRDQERLLPQIVPVNAGSVPNPPTGPTDLLWSNYPNTVNRYGGTLKLEYRPGMDFQAGITTTYFIQEDRELRHSQRLRNGTGGAASFVRFNDFFIDKPLFVFQTDFAWTPEGPHRVEGRASYSEATFNEPSNQPLFRLTGPAASFDLSVQNGVAIASNLDPRIGDSSQYALAEYVNYLDDSDDYVTEVQLDYGYNAQAGDAGWGFGAGFKLRNMVRDTDRDADVFLPAPGVDLRLNRFEQVENYTPIYANFRQIFVDFQSFLDYFNANPSDFVLDQLNTGRRTIGNDSRVEENISAVYALARHAGPRHSLIFGGRYESTETTSDFFTRTTAAGVDTFTPVTRSGDYDNFLPSVTFGYELFEGMRLRLAYAEALGRPNPSQLAGGEVLNQDGSISRPNPELRARYGRSYDAALEYYFPDDLGLFAVSLFHKEIEDEIFSIRELENINGLPTEVTTPRNVEDATVTGLELNLVVSRMPFLPGRLENFGVSSNVTFLDGRTAIQTTGARRQLDSLPGQADFLANLAIFYEEGPFRARVSYAHTGAHLTSVSPTNPAADRREKPYNSVDAQARYTVSDRLELIAEVRNLTDENRVNYTGPNQNIGRDVNFFGRQFWLGAAVRY